MSRIDDLAAHKLEVYSAAWCPDCRRLDAWLAAHRVAHQKVDIETVPGAAEQLERETGKRAIPYVRVDGGRWVRGYHKELPQRFDGDLFVEEVLGSGQ